MTAPGRAPELSPMEAAIVARFEAAEPAPESYRATVDPLDGATCDRPVPAARLRAIADGQR